MKLHNIFHINLPGSQVSVCVPWSPDNIDERNYDWVGLAESSDLFYIMDYDTCSQMFDQCVASANSPLGKTIRGIQEFINLGIDRKKLILGIPWYGYNYPCNMEHMDSITSTYCPLFFDEFRGVNCSDAAGQQYTYAYIMNLIEQKINITQITFNNYLKSYYFNHLTLDKKNTIRNIHATQQTYQIWFDNPFTLRFKYNYAKNMNIRGVGPFAFPQIYYEYSTSEMERAQEMWAAFDEFFL